MDPVRAGEIRRAALSIASELQEHGISFEGRELAVALNPTIVDAAEAERVAHAGSVIWNILNRIITRFVAEHRTGVLDGPMHRFFTPYHRWWDLIAAERRVHDHIQLMRYDAVRSRQGRWSFMETNTACPGGVIHCARIRRAWCNTSIGRTIRGNGVVTEYAIDDPEGFVRFMADRAAAIDSAQPNIAILNYLGDYTNELESLRRCHAALRDQHAIKAGELLLGDIRDLTFADGQPYLRGRPIALIHNKLDQLRIDPLDPAVSAWVRAASSPRVEFLNSLGALYLTEAKRSLALLSDPRWNRYLRLTDEEAQTIAEYVPYTRLLEDLAEDCGVHDSLPARARQSFVLKADSLTRGCGVFLGDQSTDESWAAAVAQTRANHGVAQLKCELTPRTGTRLDQNSSPTEVAEFFGVDVFFFGEQFSGLVGRSHTSQVFNVGNGGRETPVLIMEGYRG